MDFRIRGLPPATFDHLFDLTDDALARLGIERQIVDSHPGFPDRITLEDIPVGENVLVLNYEHQPAPTPFRASHAIYVRERAADGFDAVNRVPPALASRLISLRAFDAGHRMIDADISEGGALPGLIRRLFEDPRAAYLHAHYAKRGCYAARVDRA